jgi:beta-phosphoglucomutase-like phosphatase (HAD superfamily)
MDLVRERGETADLLADIARVAGSRSSPWLSPVPVTNAMLGLPATLRACLFDVEGVLTDSAVLHAWAWGQVFDDYLRRLSETTEWPFIPFDRVTDYRAYVDGRSRLEGVRAFLDSRGIHVPEGRPDDPADVDTVHGLARRKGKMLEKRLTEQGVTALPGARRYLEASRRAGLMRAVVSASVNTVPILEGAGLAPLVDARVDAVAMRAEGLRSRPAPDILLAACRQLDVIPTDAVTFVHSSAGVAAGHAAGLEVIGVGHGARAELLQDFGADRVVSSLADLLDSRLVNV